eukprot:6186037-Pleurochrysis_carterae.AAC.5
MRAFCVFPDAHATCVFEGIQHDFKKTANGWLSFFCRAVHAAGLPAAARIWQYTSLDHKRAPARVPWSLFPGACSLWTGPNAALAGCTLTRDSKTKCVMLFRPRHLRRP